jgi:hypothetical protein
MRRTVSATLARSLASSENGIGREFSFLLNKTLRSALRLHTYVCWATDHADRAFLLSDSRAFYDAPLETSCLQTILKQADQLISFNGVFGSFLTATRLHVLGPLLSFFFLGVEVLSSGSWTSFERLQAVQA